MRPPVPRRFTFVAETDRRIVVWQNAGSSQTTHPAGFWHYPAGRKENMALDLEAEIIGQIRSGLAKAIQEKLSGYQSPLQTLVNNAVENHAAEIRELLTGSVKQSLSDPDFRKQIQDAVKTKLARLLVERFGGELEKQVNQLKSEPSTRAKIMLAIQEIVSDK
jgi:hypothetical protein